jgi:hypothetical protein
MKTPALTLLLALAAAPTVARNRPVPPATPNGPPVDCISTINLHSQVRSDRVIDLTSGRKAWRNTLPNACPSLAVERAFSYRTHTSQLCSTDIITVIQTPGLSTGPSCGLGRFQPVTLSRKDR